MYSITCVTLLYLLVNGSNAPCRTHNNEFKLQEARFQLNIRKNFLSVRAVRQWNQLPQELVSAPTVEAFKKNLDNHLSDLL